MPCNEQWCLECYILSIFLSSENKENKIEFKKPEPEAEIQTTPIYLIENQSALQLKYFNNNGQGIKPKKAHKIDAGYDLRYSGKNTLTVLNFLEIIEHSLPKINPNPSSENYHVVIKKLSRINIGQLEPQQQNQLKELIAEFANIFAENNNDLERTDLVQHQIYTGDAKPRQQQAY
ncbi:hypothetical protein G9A89_007863 [Geosiphon pyriformis]|nr:hypothetical protein G9A89_007863 [Geosiphon pyriformis]